MVALPIAIAVITISPHWLDAIAKIMALVVIARLGVAGVVTITIAVRCEQRYRLYAGQHRK